MENSTATVPTMLSINETAKRTGLSALYLRKLCWDNKISFVRTGKKYLINLDRLIDYLNK